MHLFLPTHTLFFLEYCFKKLLPQTALPFLTFVSIKAGAMQIKGAIWKTLIYPLKKYTVKLCSFLYKKKSQIFNTN